jgi:hypothetical protein
MVVYYRHRGQARASVVWAAPITKRRRLAMQGPKETYEAPRLYELGRVTSLTLGHGGSTPDGTLMNDQRGSGNDGKENPPGPGGD